jgi:hypothetical protein
LVVGGDNEMGQDKSFDNIKGILLDLGAFHNVAVGMLEGPSVVCNLLALNGVQIHPVDVVPISLPVLIAWTSHGLWVNRGWQRKRDVGYQNRPPSLGNGLVSSSVCKNDFHIKCVLGAMENFHEERRLSMIPSDVTST